MTKEQLVEIVKKLIVTDVGLDFLAKLSKSELETLVSTVRNKVVSLAAGAFRGVVDIPITVYPVILSNKHKAE